jgi:hypothetical protein
MNKNGFSKLNTCLPIVLAVKTTTSCNCNSSRQDPFLHGCAVFENGSTARTATPVRFACVNNALKTLHSSPGLTRDLTHICDIEKDEVVVDELETEVFGNQGVGKVGLTMMVFKLVQLQEDR